MITAEQRELRKKYIGSSDAAAICGVDPYRVASDVWLEKTGRADGFEGNEATDRGNLLEPVLLNYAEQRLGVTLQRDVHVTREDAPELAANLDGLTPGDPQNVEAKSTVIDEGWGDEETDDVPERVLVQTHFAMWMIGDNCRVSWVPVLLPGFRSFDFRLYRVERNDELATAVVTRCREFKAKFIDTDTPPEDYRPSMDVVKRVRREANKIVEVPDLAVTLWLAAKEKKKLAEQEVERAQADLLAAIGDAEGATCNQGKLTYFSQTVKRIDGEQLRSKYPDVASSVGYTTSHRVMRFKANKETK